MYYIAGKRTKPVLTLDVDQIADLGFYRGGREHSCEAVLGYPTGTLSVVYKKTGDSSFQEFSSAQLDNSYTTSTSDVDSCTQKQTATFGLVFTAADDGAAVKCILSHSGDDLESEVDTLQLIPCELHSFKYFIYCKF